LERAAAQGFREFYLAVHYLEEVIRRHIGDGSGGGVKVRYVQEPTPLGTAGALRSLAGELKEDALVMNGDLLTDISLPHLLKSHGESGRLLTVAVKQQSYEVPYGVVRMEGDAVTGLEEKPVKTHFINAGVYAVSPAAIGLIPPAGPFGMTDLIRAALTAGKGVGAFPVHEYWLDIGRPEDYARADKAAGKEKP
jgi:NDP-sugar pyrophosphorylase family protein